LFFPKTISDYLLEHTETFHSPRGEDGFMINVPSLKKRRRRHLSVTKAREMAVTRAKSACIRCRTYKSRCEFFDPGPCQSCTRISRIPLQIPLAMNWTPLSFVDPTDSGTSFKNTALKTVIDPGYKTKISYSIVESHITVTQTPAGL
jgi:hypothetical protein